MKTAGEVRLKTLFSAANEAGNAALPEAQVRALFDDQVHDSRAWFMHSTSGAREPWSSYFRYRMIYSGETSNKPLSPLLVAGAVVGAATLAGGVAFVIRQKKAQEKLSGLASLAGALSLEAQAMDILSGKPLPMLPDADHLRAFTQQPGAVVAQQKITIAEQQLAQARAVIRAHWPETVWPAVET